MSDAQNLYRLAIYKHMSFYASVAGANMADCNFKPHFLTYFWLILNASWNLSALYTVIAFHGSDISWRSATIQSLCLQGFVKYIIMILHSKRINEKIQFIGHLYTANLIRSTANYGDLFESSSRSLFFVKYGFYMVLLSTASFFLYPMYMYLWYGESYTLLVPMLLPGIDEQTTFGYMILSLYHFSSLVLCVFGTCNLDFWLVLLVIHLWPMSDIIHNMFVELNAALLDEKCRRSQELCSYFRNIIHLHREHCEYLADLSAIFYPVVFCEVFTNAESMCTLMYCMLTMDWPPAYFLFGLMFFKLLAYCGLGTLAELSTDRVYQTLLESKWYLLPYREKHFMRLMILRAQNPTILMAGTMKLNLDTFVKTMKTVYSVGMVLLRSSSN